MENKKIAIAAAGVAGISYLLGWIYKYIPDGIANLSFSAIEIPVREQIKAGINTSLAGKLLGYLGGIIPQGGTIVALVTLYVAALIIVWLGSFISEKVNLGKTETTKFAIGLTIAAGIIGIVMGYLSPSINSLGVAVAMLIYFGIISLVYVAARNIEGIKDWLPVL